jgi:hypothetical protein
MSEVNQKVFKGVWIPYEVWKLDALTWMEKCLWAEISFLGTEEKPCFASNAYLADVFKSTESSISNMISRLKKYEMIKYISNDGRSRQMIAVIPSIKPQKIIRKGKCMSEPSLHACVNPDFTHACNIDTRVVTKGDNPLTPLNKEIANANDSEPAKEASLSVASKETPPADAARSTPPNCGHPPQGEYSEAFEKFWAAYPRKIAKKNAYREWNRCKVDLPTALKAIEQQRAKGLFKEEKFIPYPERWIKNGRWEECETAPQPASKPAGLAGGIAGREDDFWAWVHSKRPWEERRPTRAVPEEWVWDFLHGTKDEDLF